MSLESFALTTWGMIVNEPMRAVRRIDSAGWQLFAPKEWPVVRALLAKGPGAIVTREMAEAIMDHAAVTAEDVMDWPRINRRMTAARVKLRRLGLDVAGVGQTRGWVGWQLIRYESKQENAA